MLSIASDVAEMSPSIHNTQSKPCIFRFNIYIFFFFFVKNPILSFWLCLLCGWLLVSLDCHFIAIRWLLYAYISPFPIYIYLMHHNTHIDIIEWVNEWIHSSQSMTSILTTTSLYHHHLSSYSIYYNKPMTCRTVSSYSIILMLPYIVNGLLVFIKCNG